MRKDETIWDSLCSVYFGDDTCFSAFFYLISISHTGVFVCRRALVMAGRSIKVLVITTITAWDAYLAYVLSFTLILEFCS